MLCVLLRVEYFNEFRPGVPAPHITYCSFPILIWSCFRTSVRSVPTPLRFLVRGLVAIPFRYALSSINPFRWSGRLLKIAVSWYLAVHAKIRYKIVVFPSRMCQYKSFQFPVQILQMLLSTSLSVLWCMSAIFSFNYICSAFQTFVNIGHTYPFAITSASHLA